MLGAYSGVQFLLARGTLLDPWGVINLPGVGMLRPLCVMVVVVAVVVVTSGGMFLRES